MRISYLLNTRQILHYMVSQVIGTTENTKRKIFDLKEDWAGTLENEMESSISQSKERQSTIHAKVNSPVDHRNEKGKVQVEKLHTTNTSPMEKSSQVERQNDETIKSQDVEVRQQLMGSRGTSGPNANPSISPTGMEEPSSTKQRDAQDTQESGPENSNVNSDLQEVIRALPAPRRRKRCPDKHQATLVRGISPKPQGELRKLLTKLGIETSKTPALVWRQNILEILARKEYVETVREKLMLVPLKRFPFNSFVRESWRRYWRRHGDFGVREATKRSNSVLVDKLVRDAEEAARVVCRQRLREAEEFINAMNTKPVASKRPLDANATIIH